jgi:hypothetical protein
LHHIQWFVSKDLDVSYIGFLPFSISFLLSSFYFFVKGKNLLLGRGGIDLGKAPVAKVL